MNNFQIPAQDSLPTSRQLLKSTAIALVVAIVILTTVILPSEYAIDPTGAGRMLGLTEMGEIKMQLAREAAADAAAEVADDAGATVTEAGEPAAVVQAQVAAPDPITQWRNEAHVVLQPGEGAEIKLGMQAGQRAEYHWEAVGGAVNFDLHGDGSGESISYERGRNQPSGQGTFEAAFDGNHGWFWRNRGDGPVTVIVRARGEYSEMKGGTPGAP
jgi:hypothetical protein